MRNYLKYHSPGVQFVVLIGLAAGLFFINGFITIAFFGDATRALSSTTNAITQEQLAQVRWAQLISSVMTFLLPALLYAYLSDEHPLSYLGVKRDVKLMLVFAALFLLPAVEPFAMYMAQLNQQVNFGPSQKAFEDLEKASETVMNNFVKMKSQTDLLANLFVVAIVPAINEELFFRSSLQNILERWTRSPWTAIILSSFVFAFLHVTIFKFLAYFILGLTLGTLFYFTRNIWYNILFHLLNNALGLIVAYYASHSAMLKNLSDDNIKINVVVALVSLAVTILIFVAIRKRVPYEPLPGPTTPTHFDIE